jgi:hypothetical protein
VPSAEDISSFEVFMSFRSVFLAVVVAFALFAAAFLIQRAAQSRKRSAERRFCPRYRQGGSAMASGCEQCHSIGKPNSDGTIGSCTACHTRRISSVRIARLPSTCAQ